MVYLSVILFIVYCLGIGLGLGRFVKESEDFLERNLMRMGIGLGGMLTIGFILNLLKIPLDWKIFLFISAIPIVILIFRMLKNTNILKYIKNFKINIYHLIMLILFFISLYMYVKGAFAYPYLEDDDSWSHALGVKYVSIEKTVFAGVKSPFHYLDPYPPAYDMLFGILHQTNGSVYFTLKFFNALIVSLSLIFFYFFAKEFTNSSKKALLCAFALFAVPAFLSHFIWSISLTMALFFVSFYAAEKIKNDNKWWLVTAIVIVPTITSSPTHSAYFGLFFIIYFVARTLVEKRLLLYEFFAGLFGLLMSFILWWLPMIMSHGLRSVYKNFVRGPSITNIVGTADRVYNLSEFIFAKKVNMINNPIGIGVVLSILTVMGLIFIILKYKDMFKKENYYKFVLILWFIFAFYAVNAARFPIRLSPFRAWILLAIPVSVLSGEAISLINDFVRGLIKNFVSANKAIVTGASLLVLGLIVYGVIITSFVQKYAVNTALWGPGGFWTSNEEIQGYIWFKDNVPQETKVFTFSNNALIIGLDKFICHWCSEVRDYQHNGFNQTPQQSYNWLKKWQYKYIIIDAQTARTQGVNETGNKLNELLNSGLFRPEYSTRGFILLEIVSK